MALLKEVDEITRIQDEDFCVYKDVEKTVLDCTQCLKWYKLCTYTQKAEVPKTTFICPKCERLYPAESKIGDNCFNCADLDMRITKGTVEKTLAVEK